MVSVIICSKDLTRAQRLADNVRDTVGVPFELIIADNSSGSRGICQVYNETAGSASFDILCFVHEDVLFETNNWGRRLKEYLSEKKTGLIGIAGGDTRSIVPSSWYVPAKSNNIHVVQHYRYRNAQPEHIAIFGDPNNRPYRVAALDGVFLCTTKEIFSLYQFDPVCCPGFHGYDIDYSLQVSTTHDLLAVPDILIHHYSEGKPDRKWLASAIAVSEKWRKRLPVSVHPLTRREFRDHHWKTMQIFLQRLVTLEYTALEISVYFIRYSFGEYFNLRRFGSMTKYLLFCLIERRKNMTQNNVQQSATI